MLPLAQKSKLAATLIYGKLKNQQNLIKYFHKYHKTTSETLCAKYKEIIPQLSTLSKACKQISASVTVADDYRTKLLSLEAQGAEAYWDYIRELISDDNVHVGERTCEKERSERGNGAKTKKNRIILPVFILNIIVIIRNKSLCKNQSSGISNSLLKKQPESRPDRPRFQF